MIQDYPDITVYDNVDTILNSGIDAVAIATPVATHFALAEQFLRAGIDVFVEKPIATSVEETQKLADLAAKFGNILMTGHLLLYQPAIKFIQDYLDSGALGKIFCLHMERKNFGTVRSFENVMWSLGVHDIAVMVYLLGGDPVFLLMATVSQPNIQDSVYLSLHFPENVLAHLHNSWLWHEKVRFTTVIGSMAFLCMMN